MITTKILIRIFFCYWICLALSVVLYGCGSNSVTSEPKSTSVNATLTPTIMASKTVTPVTLRATPTHQNTFTAEFGPTVIATSRVPVLSTPVIIKPDLVFKDLLMSIKEKQFDSIGILPAGETNPQIFLREPKHSFEFPVWSHDGEWVAFRQTDYGIHTDKLGIIRKNGTGKRIFAPAFELISPPVWSADDHFLGSLNFTKKGVLPFVVNIETEQTTTLFPHPATDFSNDFASVFELSPNNMQAVFIGLSKENLEQRELWLLSLDGNHQEQLTIPDNMVTGCYDFPNLTEWSPNGEYFMVEFYEAVGKGCQASLWLYDLAKRTWSQVVRQPVILYSRLGEGIFWSSNGKWLAWVTKNGLSIYLVDNWDLQRYVDFSKGVNAQVFSSPWVIDNHGNEIFTIYRSFTIPGLTNTRIDIWGISPNGTETDDQLLLKIQAKEPPEIPIGSFSPRMWQP